MSVYIASKKGHRPRNEDSHNYILNISGKDNNMAKANFYGLYDGHGDPHTQGGKVISQYLADHIFKYFMHKKVTHPLSSRYISNVFNHVQKDIQEKHPIISRTCGSTCLLVIQHHAGANNHECLTIINTGDSRGVLCRDNTAHPITKDHKPCWPEERSRIEKMGGIIQHDGYDWRIKDLSVSRSFGDVDAKPFVTQTPDIFKLKLSKKDRFIILACDGLWDVMTNQDAVNYVIDNCFDSMGQQINQNINIAKKLAELALQKGSGDNVTVIVVFL